MEKDCLAATEIVRTFSFRLPIRDKRSTTEQAGEGENVKYQRFGHEKARQQDRVAKAFRAPLKCASKKVFFFISSSTMFVCCAFPSLPFASEISALEHRTSLFLSLRFNYVE